MLNPQLDRSTSNAASSADAIERRHLIADHADTPERSTDTPSAAGIGLHQPGRYAAFALKPIHNIRVYFPAAFARLQALPAPTAA